MIALQFILLFAVVQTTKQQYSSTYLEHIVPWDTKNNDTSLYIPSLHNYEKISLIKPKFKSKGVDWFEDSNAESSATQNRHLEWLEGSDSDSQSASDNKYAFLDEIIGEEDNAGSKEELSDKELRDNRRGKHESKYLLPLLMAYKLKFFMLVPLFIGALTLLVSTTGMAGFFFALFAAAIGLHVKTKH